MTTHELAKKLLEGPDVMVVHDVDAGYGETQPDEITATEQIVLWKQLLVGPYWSDMSEREPEVSDSDRMKIHAVRLV